MAREMLSGALYVKIPAAVLDRRNSWVPVSDGRYVKLVSRETKVRSVSSKLNHVIREAGSSWLEGHVAHASHLCMHGERSSVGLTGMSGEICMNQNFRLKFPEFCSELTRLTKQNFWLIRICNC